MLIFKGEFTEKYESLMEKIELILKTNETLKNN